jgi:hypothetical protein
MKPGIDSTGIARPIVLGFLSASSKVLSPTDHLTGKGKAGTKLD